MKMHTLKLATEPFDAIKSGQKIIESRLYDEKRREIELGDEIEFTNRDSGEKLLSEVVGLHRYRDFETMFERMDPAKFGGESKEWLLNQYGVIGIEFK